MKILGGGGSNNKKDHAAGKNLRCPLSFLFFFKTRSKSTFLCRIWSKMCPQKRTKKIMIFVFLIFYVLFCSFLLFLPDLVNKMSSNREQKRTKKIMPPGKSQDVLCLFCCWTPPPPPPPQILRYILYLTMSTIHYINVFEYAV